jgi:sugar phosphate isomerase/epimerase
MWREDAEATMRRLVPHGYSDFDIFLTPPSFWPSAMTTHERSQYRRRLEQESMRIDSVNFPNYDYNPAAPTEAARKFSIGLLAEQISVCAEMGIKRFIIIPGRYGLSSPPVSFGLDWLHRCFDLLLPLAEREGVQLVIENVPSTVLPSVSDIITFVAAYDHPNLAMCYDVANAEFVGDDHYSLLLQAAKWLAQVHFSDATRTRWAHDPVGHGTVDFAGIGRLLVEIGFSQVAINEVRGDPQEEAIIGSQRALFADYGWPAAG